MAGLPDADGRSDPPLLRDPLLWAVALIAVAVCLPFFRYVQWLGDEGVVLHGAERVVHGQALYRDFFEFLPPGSFLIVAAWMKLVGVGFASVRALAIGVTAATAALLYAGARLSSGNRPLAALLAVTWAVVSQGAWTVISHHWFTTVAASASAAGLLVALGHAGGGAGAFAAGLFAGTAALVVPTRGGLLCVAVVAVLLAGPRPRARLASALGGMAVFPAAMLLHLAATGALAVGLYDFVVFPARRYAGIQGVPFGSFAGLHNALAAAFFPLTFVLAGAFVALEGVAAWRAPRFRASLALALAGLLGTFPRPDLAHINFTVPLACPLFALVTTGLLRRLGRPARVAVGSLAIALCCVAIGYALTKKVLPMLAGPLREVPTARGVIVAPQGLWTDAVAALVAQVDGTPPGAAFFFYPYSPMLPYLTGRRHVAAIDVMLPGYTTAEQYRETCVRVAREALWVVIDRSWADPRILRAFFPAMRDADPPEKRGFEAALRLAFDDVVHASRIFELRRRTRTGSPVTC
ncbi:MAG: hypothetical protein HY294_02450 [Candidatus Rokubacteria bacterium]|nr:hypothetical protein [Candidatus Rokubacteria bacterium]MBI3824838.1 hypothetical protein [Candidatus Rokubacteria bacterium]